MQYFDTIYVVLCNALYQSVKNDCIKRVLFAAANDNGGLAELASLVNHVHFYCYSKSTKCTHAQNVPQDRTR